MLLYFSLQIINIFSEGIVGFIESSSQVFILVSQVVDSLSELPFEFALNCEFIFLELLSGSIILNSQVSIIYLQLLVILFFISQDLVQTGKLLTHFC